MENAFLIRRLSPWFTNTKKRIVKSPKVYIRDTGILLHLLKVYSMKELLGHPQCGMVWEGFVLEQCAATFGNKFDYFFYRTQDGAETDLVLTKAGKPFVAIESKFSNSPTITAGTHIAIADLKTKNNYVVTPRNEAGSVPLASGLLLLNIETLLTSAPLLKK